MKKRSVKQIAALAAVILLAAMYIVTLLVAIFDKSASGKLFLFCAVCTVAVPLLAWIFIWLYGQYSGKKTIADLHLMQDADAAVKAEEPVEENAAEGAVDMNEADAEAEEK